MPTLWDVHSSVFLIFSDSFLSSSPVSLIQSPQGKCMVILRCSPALSSTLLFSTSFSFFVLLSCSPAAVMLSPSLFLVPFSYCRDHTLEVEMGLQQIKQPLPNNLPQAPVPCSPTYTHTHTDPKCHFHRTTLLHSSLQKPCNAILSLCNADLMLH